jgi:AcrR family transcriptional regulator
VPRAGLSPHAVVDLALAVVDEGGPDGFAALGLSAVARRVGVAVPSLYKHVDGLPALRAEVARRCVDDLTATMESAVAGATGAQALRRLASATRGYALAHPGRYRAVQGAEAAALGPSSARPARLVARAVEQLGAPPERWVDQVRAVRAAVHGFVELELAGGFGMPEDVDVSFDYLVDALVAGLS